MPCERYWKLSLRKELVPQPKRKKTDSKYRPCMEHPALPLAKEQYNFAGCTVRFKEVPEHSFQMYTRKSDSSYWPLSQHHHCPPDHVSCRQFILVILHHLCSICRRCEAIVGVDVTMNVEAKRGEANGCFASIDWSLRIWLFLQLDAR